MGEVKTVFIFGWHRLQGAILFHAIMENGAVFFYRLPISAFHQRGFDVKKVPRPRLDELELWNCFSYYPAVTTYDILAANQENIW